MSVDPLLVRRIMVVMGNISFESRETYAARFHDVQGLLVNDDVTISGVTLGKVTDIGHLPGGVVGVTFSLRDDIEATTRPPSSGPRTRTTSPTPAARSSTSSRSACRC